MFSPYYAFARRGGRQADPHDYCCLNVVLYGDAGKRFTMLERKAAAVSRDAEHFAIGPSQLRWQGDTLVIDIDEVSAPIPRRVRGQVRVTPPFLTDYSFALDSANQHRWWPLCPRARVEVAMTEPARRWSGTGYFDTNAGLVPLERSFHDWHWSRGAWRDEAAILYTANRRDGTSQALALRVDARGTVSAFEPPPLSALPRTRWRLPRATHTDPGARAKILATLEDTPFYARSVLGNQLDGERMTAVHESLSLDRFSHPATQFMLPFRVMRRFWA